LTSSVAWPRCTVAVCGTLFAMAASRAGTVPATDASTLAFGCSGGMRAKSAGSAFAATNAHGPFRPDALNQRPVRRT
jgi:hypothetical protein